MSTIQKILIALFELKCFGFSLYYFLEVNNSQNLICLILQSSIIFGMISIYRLKLGVQNIILLFGLQISLICIIMSNQFNEQNYGFLEVIIVHVISAQLIEDQIRYLSRQKFGSHNIVKSFILLQSAIFVAIFSLFHMDLNASYFQGLICLVISFVANYQITKKPDLITITKYRSESQQIIKQEQPISIRDKLTLELEKISPDNSNQTSVRYFKQEDQKRITNINSELLDVIMQYSHEGLVALKKPIQKEQPLEIVHTNIATKSLFQVNSNKEILDILDSFKNLTFQYHELVDDIQFRINQQKKFQKSLANLKSDLLLSSSKQNFQYLFETHSVQNVSSNLRDIFNKFNLNNKQEHFIVITHYPNNNNCQSSQTEKQNERLIEMTISQIEDKYIVIVIRDITHKQKIRYLKEYDIQKSKTLSYVSHEYRSPLNCIIQMLENILNNHQQSVENQEMLQAALDNSYYILNLSNDLLDLAQIKNGKFTIQKCKFNLEQLITECLKLFALKAKIVNINLTVSFDTLAPNIIVSDRNRLKQIIVNLLSNSFKFATAKITIKVLCIDYTTLRIGVQDDGIGISEEDQKHLFKSFSKVNSEESRKRNEQGVGLGLLISNQIAENIGCGGLQIDSKPNLGTFFYLDLQFDNPRLKKVSSYRIREVKANSQEVEEGSYKLDKRISIELEPPSICMHILIVDDEIFNVYTFTKILNSKKITDIDTACNGHECVEKVKNKKCSDFCTEMPIMNGQMAAKNILQLIPNQIIIACSGYTDHNEKKICLTLGMVDYIVKPIRDSEITFILKTYYFI